MPRFSQKTPEEIRLYELKAEELEIKIEKMRDGLISVDVVASKLKEVVAAISSRLDVIPKEVVYSIMPEDPIKMENLIKTNIDLAKKELANLDFGRNEEARKLEIESLVSKASVIRAQIRQAQDELEKTKKATTKAKKTTTRKKKATTKLEVVTEEDSD